MTRGCYCCCSASLGLWGTRCCAGGAPEGALGPLLGRTGAVLGRPGTALLSAPAHPGSAVVPSSPCAVRAVRGARGAAVPCAAEPCGAGGRSAEPRRPCRAVPNRTEPCRAAPSYSEPYRSAGAGPCPAGRAPLPAVPPLPPSRCRHQPEPGAAGSPSPTHSKVSAGIFSRSRRAFIPPPAPHTAPHSRCHRPLSREAERTSEASGGAALPRVCLPPSPGAAVLLLEIPRAGRGRAEPGIPPCGL